MLKAHGAENLSAGLRPPALPFRAPHSAPLGCPYGRWRVIPSSQAETPFDAFPFPPVCYPGMHPWLPLLVPLSLHAQQQQQDLRSAPRR